MKTKKCTDCDENHLILYRIQIEKSGKWFFVCKNCIENTPTQTPLPLRWYMEWKTTLTEEKNQLYEKYFYFNLRLKS